jgi:mitogen-activated protein kinase kinase kinase
VRYIGTARDEGLGTRAGDRDETQDVLNTAETPFARLFIFLEYVPGGSISSLLQRFGPLETSVISVYASQILVGLDYLHSQRVAHRDVKGANILVEKSGRVKLADFGAAKLLAEQVSGGSLGSGRRAEGGPDEDGNGADKPLEISRFSENERSLSDSGSARGGTDGMAGSAYWMAPEVIRRRSHGAEADIWSVGCVVVEMATGEPPWSGCGGQAQAIYKIASTKELPAFPESFSDENGGSLVQDFTRMCLRRDPSERPSAAELLTHPFVSEVARDSKNVPALQYEYEGYWSGEDGDAPPVSMPSDVLVDREMETNRTTEERFASGRDRAEPEKTPGQTLSETVSEMEDWRVEVETMRRLFATEEDLSGTDDDETATDRANEVVLPPPACTPSSAMPRPPTLANGTK